MRTKLTEKKIEFPIVHFCFIIIPSQRPVKKATLISVVNTQRPKTFPWLRSPRDGVTAVDLASASSRTCRFEGKHIPGKPLAVSQQQVRDEHTKAGVQIGNMRRTRLTLQQPEPGKRTRGLGRSHRYGDLLQI